MQMRYHRKCCNCHSKHQRRWKALFSLSLSLCPIFEAINVEQPLFPPRILQKMTSLSGICVLFLFIILSCNADVSTYHNGNGSSPYLPQSPKSATELIAALDGTVSLVNSASGKVIWSFSAGPPIHRSFQAPMNDSNKAASGLIEVGDDWELIIHDTDLGKTKLSQSLVEYVVSTPIVSKNKAIIDGSKFSTVFYLDAKTGRLVWSDDKDRNNEVPTQLSSTEFLLTIVRLDYVLRSVDYVDLGSLKVLWALEVAEFKAVLSCQHSGNTTSRASFDSKGEYAPDSKSGLDFAMPYVCGDRKYREVYRQRNTCCLTKDLPRKISAKQVAHFLQH